MLIRALLLNNILAGLCSFDFMKQPKSVDILPVPRMHIRVVVFNDVQPYSGGDRDVAVADEHHAVPARAHLVRVGELGIMV